MFNEDKYSEARRRLIEAICYPTPPLQFSRIPASDKEIVIRIHDITNPKRKTVSKRKTYRIYKTKFLKGYEHIPKLVPACNYKLHLPETAFNKAWDKLPNNRKLRAGQTYDCKLTIKKPNRQTIIILQKQIYICRGWKY